MKTLFILLSTSLFTTMVVAQNKDILDVTKTTTTTIKDANGERKIVKKQETKEVQNIELKDAKPNTINVEVKDSPVQVQTVTKISDSEGNTTFVEKDHSGNYVLNGVTYQLILDTKGYLLSTAVQKKVVLIRKTGTTSLILPTKEYSGVGYFDADGNLIIEKYFNNSITLITDKYILLK